jgi:hypothetical protein
MHDAKELIIQQQKEVLEELGKTTVTLARLRKLIREQHSYEPAAFEESVKVLMGKLSHTGPDSPVALLLRWPLRR